MCKVFFIFWIGASLVLAFRPAFSHASWQKAWSWWRVNNEKEKEKRREEIGEEEKREEENGGEEKREVPLLFYSPSSRREKGKREVVGSEEEQTEGGRGGGGENGVVSAPQQQQEQEQQQQEQQQHHCSWMKLLDGTRRPGWRKWNEPKHRKQTTGWWTQPLSCSYLKWLKKVFLSRGCASVTANWSQLAAPLYFP